MRNELNVSRRQFLKASAAVAGTAVLSRWSMPDAHAATATSSTAAAVRRTATDQVTLGKTGIKLSRLGIGTGVDGGRGQAVFGKEAFSKLIKHAYDQGITYIDAAQNYQTFTWIGDAIKGLPREKLFIQSKIPNAGRDGNPPEDILAAIDNHRKVYNTDYIDSMLVHCMTRDTWTDQWKRAMDGFNEAKERKWIRSKGVSCHRFGALQAATASDFNEVHLVRVNPQGWHMDDVARAGESEDAEIAPVIAQIKEMHAKGRGVIGMKIFGNGDFKTHAAREKSLRYAMSMQELDAIVIGFETPALVDDTIKMMNGVLAEV
jgi:predicted aldo/keto reductase-like oxidoreductase